MIRFLLLNFSRHFVDSDHNCENVPNTEITIPVSNISLDKDLVSVQKTVKSKSFGALKTHTDKSPSVAQLNTNLHTFKYFKYPGDFDKYYCSLVGLTSVHAQGHCTAKCYQRFHRLAASESCLSTLLCCLNVAFPLLKADCVNISFVTSACLLSTAQRLVVEISNF